MLNLENYIFKGTSNNCDSSLLVTLFNLIGIDRNEWSLNSIFKYYWIENKKVYAADINRQELPNKQLIRIDQLIELILSDRPELEEKVWWRHLKPGSKVVINIPSNESSDHYPCGIYEAMRKLDGETVTIAAVCGRTFGYSSSYSKRMYFNGDYSGYDMVELPGYIFHSSMFLAPDTKPVKKLQLSSVGDSVLKSIEEIEQDSIFDDVAFLEKLTRSIPVRKVDRVRFADIDLPW